MLNRSSRLTTKLFNEVMKNGKVVHSTFFIARIQVGVPSLRVSSVAPVKIAKTAVLRNRTRRRIYSALRPVLAGVTSKANIILVAKPPLLQNDDIEEVREDIRNLFVKAGLLR